jgi:hypothetical protein
VILIEDKRLETSCAHFEAKTVGLLGVDCLERACKELKDLLRFCSLTVFFEDKARRLLQAIARFGEGKFHFKMFDAMGAKTFWARC